MAAFRVADHGQVYTDLLQHDGGNLPGELAFILPAHVLGSDPDPSPRRGPRGGFQGGVGRDDKQLQTDVYKRQRGVLLCAQGGAGPGRGLKRLCHGADRVSVGGEGADGRGFERAVHHLHTGSGAVIFLCDLYAGGSIPAEQEEG